MPGYNSETNTCDILCSNSKHLKKTMNIHQSEGNKMNKTLSNLLAEWVYFVKHKDRRHGMVVSGREPIVILLGHA